MVPLKFKLDRKSLEVMYNAFVLPIMEYGNVVSGGSYDSDIAKLEHIHVKRWDLLQELQQDQILPDYVRTLHGPQ